MRDFSPEAQGLILNFRVPLVYDERDFLNQYGGPANGGRITDDRNVIFSRDDLLTGQERVTARYRYAFDGLTPQYRLVRVNRVNRFESPNWRQEQVPNVAPPRPPEDWGSAGSSAGQISLQNTGVDWAAFGQGAGQVYDQAAVYGQGMWHVTTTTEPEFVVPSPIDVQERINQLIAEGESRGQEEQEQE